MLNRNSWGIIFEFLNLCFWKMYLFSAVGEFFLALQILGKIFCNTHKFKEFFILTISFTVPGQLFFPSLDIKKTDLYAMPM